MLIDAHNHLQDDLLQPHLDGIFDSLQKLDLSGMIVNGTTTEDWSRVAQLAAKHRSVIASYGLHPWYLDQRPRDWEATLREYLEADPSACLGETGVDRWMRDPDEPAQREVVTRHLELACEYRRPVTLHCLRAWGWLGEILRETDVPPDGFLVHAFGGSQEVMEALAEQGAYFSFNPSFLQENRHKKRAVFQQIPADRLLVETDAPSMPPPPELAREHLPPAPNGAVLSHPANIALAYDGLAELRDCSREELEPLVASNFERFTRALPRRATVR